MTRVFNRMRSLFGVPFVLMLAMIAGPTMATAQQAGEAAVVSEPITVLLMVSDASGEEATTDGASDVMAVVHLDPSTQSCRALNILPNTGVELAGVGNTRINQALPQGGTDLAVSTVESLLGVDVTNYGVIDLDGIIMGIDLIGGVTVNNPEAFTVDGNSFPAGEITLSGEQALIYARYTGDTGSTVTRLDRQKALVQGLVSTVGSAGLSLNNVPASVQSSAADIQDHVVTDVTLENALAVAEAYSSCEPNEQSVQTLPIASEASQVDAVTQDEQVIGVVEPAAAQAHADWLINGTELPQQ